MMHRPENKFSLDPGDGLFYTLKIEKVHQELYEEDLIYVERENDRVWL